LAHELVHRWLGPAWSTLSPALEDGLCEAIAIATHDGRTVQDRTVSFVSAWLTLNDSLIVDQDGNPADPRHETYTVRLRSKGSRLSPSDVVEAMRRDLRGYFEIGDRRQFVTVNLLSRLLLDRLTIARLFELCLEAEEHGLARVPPERVFETAGIDPLDPETWNEMLLGLYGAPERRALCEQARIPRKAHSFLSSGGQPEERVTVRLEARVTF
jgi:hypothetical protein